MLTSASFSGIRLVRGIKRGIFEERRRALSLLNITGIASRTEANVTARRPYLDYQVTKTNEEAIPSIGGANTIFESELLNESRPVVPEVVLAPMLLLTVVDAAKLLAISRTKFYELLNARAIDSVYIGRSRRIRLIDLEAFVNGLETES